MAPCMKMMYNAKEQLYTLHKPWPESLFIIYVQNMFRFNQFGNLNLYVKFIQLLSI